MSCRCGIVGLPNVGKSTFFNALTKAKVAAENYPFCTIDPNVGVVPVPDPRLKDLASVVNPQKIVPAIVELVDIAGLVKGASQGEGLGNRFLAHIRETQAIAQVVRCFEDENVVHVAGRVDPISDIETINTELMLADVETLDRALTRITSAVKSGQTQAKKQAEIWDAVRTELNNGVMVRNSKFAKAPELSELQLLTHKPMIYIANVAAEQLKDNPYVQKLEDYAAKNQSIVVPICATWEAELLELPEEEQLIFLEELGLTESGLSRVVRQIYKLLKFQTFFTAGPQEVHAWTITENTKAPAAAGVIHSDFERGFICAEVISFEDFMRYHGEHGAKEAGKLRLEGRDYVFCEGDVAHFRFNV